MFKDAFYKTSFKYSGKKELIEKIEKAHDGCPIKTLHGIGAENVHTTFLKGKYHDMNLYYNKANIPIDLVVEINEIVQTFITLKGVNHIGNFKVCEMWYNAYKYKQYQRRHGHSFKQHESFYSGIYYMKFNESCHTSTRFFNSYFNINFENEEVCKNESLVYMPKIKEDDIIIFPSAIEHDVLPQNSNETRITVAFDIKCDYNEF